MAYYLESSVTTGTARCYQDVYWNPGILSSFEPILFTDYCMLYLNIGRSVLPYNPKFAIIDYNPDRIFLISTAHISWVIPSWTIWSAISVIRSCPNFWKNVHASITSVYILLHWLSQQDIHQLYRGDQSVVIFRTERLGWSPIVWFTLVYRYYFHNWDETWNSWYLPRTCINYTTGDDQTSGTR